MKRATVRWGLAAALAWLVVVDAGGAAAQQPVETAIAQWVAAIDASPDWSAGYRDLSYDPASGTAVVTGLSVHSATAGFAVDFDSITVSGFHATSDGSFAAGRIATSDGAVVAGIFTVALSDMVLDNVVLPQNTGFVWDARRPFTSMVKALVPLTHVSMSDGHFGSVKLTEAVAGVASEISYGDIGLKGWANGLIASVTAGPLTTRSPSDLPLITMRVGQFTASDVDLGAFLHVYDPDAYVGGVGDRRWRTAVASATYDDVGMAVPGAKLAIGSVSLADLKVRQPAASFAGLFDQAMLDPFGTGSQVTAERGLDLASAFSFGRFVMQPVDVSAIGFDRLHLDRMSIDDLSMDGLGELTLDGIDVEIADQVSVKLGRLAFGGMAFPKTATIAAALDAAQTGGNVDFSSLAPTLGFFEAGDVDVDIADTPPIRLGRMRIDLANYVGQVPTAVTAAITGADVSTDVIPDDRIRRLLTEFGYQRIHLDAGVKAAWHDGDDTTAVDDFSVKLADIGTLAGKAKFAGPTRADLEQLNSPAGLDRVLAAVSLADATFTFTDDSIVGRAIAGQAARLKVDPTKFREQFARGLPFMLSFLGNRDYQAKVAPVLQAFIRAPGSITFMTTPAAPIALSQIMAAARSAPFSLPNMLALTVTGAAAAGSKPAATGTQAAPAN